MAVKFSCQVQGARGKGQDRAMALKIDSDYLFVIADGAGGSGGGGLAAQAVVDALRYTPPADAQQAAEQLGDLDLTIAASGGETTAVVAVLRNGQLYGASVGDSRALLIGTYSCMDLTSGQQRKPLLGSGRAVPIPFGPQRFHGRLLLGSDGLFNYAAAARIAELARAHSPAEAVAALIAAVRLRSGGLQDDVAVIVAADIGIGD